jgi:hypothetical protein
VVSNFQTRTLFRRSERFKHKLLFGDQIRIVKLLPALDFDDPIKCSLEHVSLGDPPPYEALSYAWGDASVTRTISLDGMPWEITVNLESALRHLRLKNFSRTLWVDALCIDQSNISERSEQVCRMLEIYEKPTQVVVWLGPAADGSDIAFDKLKELSKLVPPSSKPITVNKSGQFPWYGKIGAPNEPAAWVALQALLLRDWWHRIWVVQETTTSAKVVVTCGSTCISFEDLDRALVKIHLLWWHLGCTRQDLSGLGGAALNHLERWRELRRRRLRTYADTHSDVKCTTIPLIVLLDGFQHKNTTDQRDKVYALLNLATFSTDQMERIIPDYNLSVEEVYIQTARHIILEGRDLHAIWECLKPTTLDLPSWVPHWSPEYRERLQLITHSPRNYKDYFTADRGKSMDIQFDLWGRMIIVRGIHFDNIKTVAKFRDNALHSIEKDGAEWSGMAQMLQNGGKTPSTFRMAWRCKIDGSGNAEFTPIEDEDITKSRKTYECTIATDLRPCVIRNRPDFVRGAHDHSSEFENFPENAHSLETQDLEGLVNGRSLAITSSGRMGLVPDTTGV